MQCSGFYETRWTKCQKLQHVHAYTKILCYFNKYLAVKLPADCGLPALYLLCLCI